MGPMTMTKRPFRNPNTMGPLIGNPYNAYLNPCYTVDDHPYDRKTMGVFSPSPEINIDTQNDGPSQELHFPKHKNPSFYLVSKKKKHPIFLGENLYIDHLQTLRIFRANKGCQDVGHKHQTMRAGSSRNQKTLQITGKPSWVHAEP